MKITSLSSHRDRGPMAFSASHQTEKRTLHVWINSDRQPESVIHVNTFTGESYPDGRAKTKHSTRSLYAATNKDFLQAISRLTTADFEIAKQQREQDDRSTAREQAAENLELLRKQAAGLGFRLVPVHP